MNYIFHGEGLVKGLREKNVFIREIQPHVSLQFFFLTALQDPVRFLLVNKNKTEGNWVGKVKHSKDQIKGIKWSEKPIKALGVYFGNNKEECEN